jgi:hypothetical protein
MDGTFNYCDKNFTQLYTVHGLKNNIYISLMFSFLPDKTLKTYIGLLKKINAVGINLNKFVLDLLISMHQAINIIFSITHIWGCRFHLSQAWYHKIQSLGFAQEFNFANDELEKWLVHIFGLPFLNPIEVLRLFYG